MVGRFGSCFAWKDASANDLAYGFSLVFDFFGIKAIKERKHFVPLTNYDVYRALALLVVSQAM